MGDRARSIQSGVKEEIGIVGKGDVGPLCLVAWLILEDAQFHDRRGINWATVG